MTPLRWLLFLGGTLGCVSASACVFNSKFCDAHPENCDGAGGTATSSSSVTNASTSTGIPAGCDLVEGQAVPPTCGVFVKLGSTGDGSQATPLGDVVGGVAAVHNTPRVYICGSDTFIGGVTMASGISILGGLDCDTWTYHASNVHPKIQGAPNAPSLTISQGTDATVIASVDVAAMSSTTLGESSVAIFATDATVDLKNVSLTAGDGANGVAGTSGGAQSAVAPAGTAGGNAGTALPNAGAGAVANTCDDGTSEGGKGGDGGAIPMNSGGNANSGDAGTGADPGAGELGATLCSNGHGYPEAGVSGNDGPFGKGAASSDFGKLSASSYANAPGLDGTAGTRGKGGGGGGGSKATVALTGAGGGGGGSGGCGGHKGTGGGGGGSSIGVLAFHTALTLTDVTISLGTGGGGGKGGNGQLGQLGGAFGGAGSGGGGVNDACTGGKGGHGGNGGSGGGGRGGHAIGIAYAGNAPTGTPNLTNAGSPGLGGPGGTNTVDQATAGQNGAAVSTQALPE